MNVKLPSLEPVDMTRRPSTEAAPLLLPLLAAAVLFAPGLAQFSPNCADGRDGQVMVHLFEWKWTDIAAECERYLGPKGFCGIQVSPPNEHRVVTSPFRPWWERYQPVSYKLDSRSGSRAQFIDMVQRCNAAGVRIYVDAVINHMAGVDLLTGYGIAGSRYDTKTLEFSGVPYSAWDFNSCEKCGNSNCNINGDYGDANKVRNCRLVGLADLDCGKDYVRQKIADYMNDALSIGVDGFRIDAAKHMWPGDLSAIAGKLLSTSRGSRPYIYQEVIDQWGSEAVKSSEYLGIGAVTEFKYGLKLAEHIYGGKGLTYLSQFGSSWGMLPSDKAFVFIDNHDNQRGHGGGGTILSHKYGRPYTVALVFMLAWPYGVPQIMSSFSFTDTDQGPPSDGSGNTSDVTILPDGLCGNGWVCEHRWRPVGNMVAWRNVAGTKPVTNWWSNGWNQIAFSRGDAAFIVFNYDNGMLNAKLSTGLPPGLYCDVITGGLVDGRCSGKTVDVGLTGEAVFQISGADQDPIVAIHINAMSSRTNATTTQDPSTPTVPASTVPAPEGYSRTVVLLRRITVEGQDVFLRGGLDASRCAKDDDCRVPVRYSATRFGSRYDKFNAWKAGDMSLDWFGAESGQGRPSGQPAAQGSPMFWTTNAVGSANEPENRFGDHYWMWEVDMDCSKTYQGWFELKGFLDGQWESDISQSSSCSGTAGAGKAPFTSANHIAKCGALSVFEWGLSSCSIDSL